MARGHGRGYLAIGIAGAAVAGLLGWVGWKSITASGLPDNHVAATDSRVCRSTEGNNVPFDQVMSHFSLKLPPGAQHVVFTANVNPLFGDYSLTLHFTTTPAGLRSFLTTARLAPASPGVRTTVDFGITACGLTPPAGKHMSYSEDSASKSPRGRRGPFQPRPP